MSLNPGGARREGEQQLTETLDADGNDVTNVGALGTDDIDIAGSDLIAQGDFLGVGPYEALPSQQSTTSTSYVNANEKTDVVWDSIFPSGATTAYRGFVSISGSSSAGSVRYHNRSDGETVFEKTSFIGTEEKTGTYAPHTTASRVTIQYQFRTDDSDSATDLTRANTVLLGVEV
jgi:hypothetical protein